MFCILSTIYLLSRVFLACCVAENWPSLEYLYPATIAKEMTDGMAMSFWDYQFSSYEAGFQVAAVLGYPVIRALGFSSFSVALCSILTHLVEFSLLYLILKEHVNKRTAVFFGMQSIIAPYFFYTATLPYAFNYLNVGMLTMLFLTLFLKIFRHNTVQPVLGSAGLSLFCLGLLGGFSTWTCFAFLVVGGPCLLYWLLYYRSWDLKPIGLFLAGFVLGIAPVIFRFALFAGEVKHEMVDRVVTQSLWEAFGKFGRFLKIDVIRELSVYANIHELLTVVLLVSIVVMKRDYFKKLLTGSLGGRLRDEGENGKIFLLLAYPLFYFAVYCLSDFEDVRYLIPLYPFAFAGNAIAVDLFMRHRSRWMKAVALSGATALLLLSTADNIVKPLYTKPPSLTLMRDKGYAYELIGCLVSWRFKLDPRKVMKIAGKLSDDEKRYAFMRGFAFELALEDDGVLIPEYIKYLAKHHADDLNLLRAFNKGMLLGFGQHYFEDSQLSDYYPSVLRSVDREDAVGYFEKNVKLIASEPAQHKVDCYTGLGIQFFTIAQEIDLNPQHVYRLFEESYRQNFLDGIKLGEKYEYRI